MAATRKAAVSTLQKADVTRAKDDDGGKLAVVSARAKQLAREYSATQDQIEELQNQQTERKAQIIELVANRRLAAEQQGRFYATAQIDTDDDEALQILWTDRFREVDASHQALLRRVFGKHYDDLFRDTINAKVATDDVRLQDIQSALGTRGFDTLQKFVRVKPTIKMRKGFLETRANLRGSFDQTTNDSIDTVIGQVAYSPTVRRIKAR